MNKTLSAFSLSCMFFCATCVCRAPVAGQDFQQADYHAFASLINSYAFLKGARVQKLEQLAALSLQLVLGFMNSTLTKSELSEDEREGILAYDHLCRQIIGEEDKPRNLSKEVTQAFDYLNDIFQFSIYKNPVSLGTSWTSSRKTVDDYLEMGVDPKDKTIKLKPEQKKRLIEDNLELFNNYYILIYQAITEKYRASTKLPPQINFGLVGQYGFFRKQGRK